MKKLVSKIAAVAIATIVAFNAQSQEPAFIHNATYENEMVTSKRYYKYDNNSKLYKEHLLRKYCYNSDGALNASKISRWNETTQAMENESIITYEYDSVLNTVTMSYAIWNREINAFDIPTEKAVYQKNDDRITSFYLYTKESAESGNWIVKEYFNAENSHLVATISK